MRACVRACVRACCIPMRLSGGNVFHAQLDANRRGKKELLAIEAQGTYRTSGEGEEEKPYQVLSDPGSGLRPYRRGGEKMCAKI